MTPLEAAVALIDVALAECQGHAVMSSVHISDTLLDIRLLLQEVEEYI